MRSTGLVLRYLSALAAATLVCSGCGKQQPPSAEPDAQTPAAEAPPPDPIQLLFEAANDQLGAGNTNAARQVLLDALDNPDMVEHRGQTFNLLMRFLIYLERGNEATERFMAMLQSDVETAREGLGEIYGYFTRSKDPAGLAAWTDTLLDMDLPEDMHDQAMRWRLEAAATADDVAALEAVTDRLLGMAGEPALPSLARGFLQALLARDRFDATDAVLARLAAHESANPELSNVLIETRAQLLIKRRQWQDALTAFNDAVTVLPDGTLSRLLRTFASGAKRDNQVELLEQVCEEVLKHAADLPRTADAAARQWLENAKTRGDVAAIPERLGSLLLKGLPPRLLQSLYLRYFYDTINTPPVLKEMMDICDRLMPLIEDDNGRGQLRTMSLDASFVLEDYDRAIGLLEEGVPGHDEAWHRMALPKVRAHKALKESRLQDAVTHFREFMAVMNESEEEDTQDPSTGIVHTRDMILGRNAKRIGDILVQAGESVEAAKAYQEARDYYAKAIGKLEDKESESASLARKEMAAIPAP